MNSFPLYGYIPFCLSIYQMVGIWIAFTFWLLGIMTVCICLQVFIWTCIVFSRGQIPRNGSGIMFNQLLNYQTCLLKQLHQFILQCLSPGFSTSSSVLVIFCLLSYRYPSGYEVLLNMALTCSLLMLMMFGTFSNDVWYLFRCLLAVHICSIKFLLRYFAHLKN